MIIKKRIESANKEIVKEVPISEEKIEKNEEMNLFDIDNIDFSQRQERRRGNRRRGYRRIDDRNLISRAQEEADGIKNNAAQEGYKAGIEQAQGDIAQVKSALQSFLSAKQEVFEYIAPDILEISVEIARKIVKHEIEHNPEIILNMILDVLKTISKDESKINIRVSPEQIGIVKDKLPEITASIGLEVKTKAVADDTIEMGSCIVETSNGIVDATIDTQLEIIKEAFKGM